MSEDEGNTNTLWQSNVVSDVMSDMTVLVVPLVFLMQNFQVLSSVDVS